MKELGESQVSLVFAFRVVFPSLPIPPSTPLTLLPLIFLISVSQQICNDLITGKRINLKGGKFPNCRDLLRFDGHGHFQSLFEMGSEEDALLVREEREREKEGGEVVEGRKKGEKGWRYGAVSSRRRSSMELEMNDGSRGGRARAD